jgi:hypothetical protein
MMLACTNWASAFAMMSPLWVGLGLAAVIWATGR